jgi:CelD/BcsL family acetyltransferase involved in cellulose biosynthesis
MERHVQVTVLEKIPEETEITLAWNNLVLEMERPEVFFTQQWALAASRAFSDIRCPLTFLVYEGDLLSGVAAMALDKQPSSTVSFITSTTADYCDIVSKPETRIAVLSAVLSEMKKRGMRNIVFANVPAESYTLRAIPNIARSNHFHLHTRAAYDCGIISVRDQERRQAVLQALIRKEKERRGLKKLSHIGPVQVRHLRGEPLDNIMRPLFIAHISRFFATKRRSPLIQPQRRGFLVELGKLLSSAGWLKISQLEVNGEPVAWNYGFQFVDSWFWYLPTFQMQYEESSPGSCLLRLLVEEACGDPSLTRMDLGLGDEPYKARFSNDVSSTRYLQLTSDLVRHLGTIGRHRAAALVGTLPGLDRRLRSGRNRIRSAQKRIGESSLRATARHALTRIKRCVSSEDEVAFFEAPAFTVPEEESVDLILLSWESIALAAMTNPEDEQTLEYLARSADRLRQGSAVGYCLRRETQPSHFLWVDCFAGFHLSELDSTLESDDQTAAMIFDCWTPVAQRGQGYYSIAIRLIAAALQKQLRKPWIFSASKNESSIRGILRAGFEYRFSLVRSRKLWSASLRRREDTNFSLNSPR